LTPQPSGPTATYHGPFGGVLQPSQTTVELPHIPKEKKKTKGETLASPQELKPTSPITSLSPVISPPGPILVSAKALKTFSTLFRLSQR